MFYENAHQSISCRESTVVVFTPLVAAAINNFNLLGRGLQIGRRQHLREIIIVPVCLIGYCLGCSLFAHINSELV